MNKILIFLFASILFMGCAAEDDNNDESSSTTSGSTTNISSSVTAAAVSGANCQVEDIDGKLIVGPVSSDSNGEYDLTINESDLSKTLVFVCRDGSYNDEATDSNVELSDEDEMAVILKPSELDDSAKQAHITAATTLVKEAAMTHYRNNSDDTNISEAIENMRSDFESAYGISADHTNKPSSSSTKGQQANLEVTAFSQLAKDKNISPAKQIEMLRALAQDLSDRVVDGQFNSAAVSADGQSFSDPTGDFQASYGKSFTNLFSSESSRESMLKDKNVKIPYITSMVTSNDFRVTIVSGDHLMGRSDFKFQVVNNADDTVVTNVSIDVTPLMFMFNNHNHGTSVKDCDKLTNEKDFLCTIYYIMPSASNGNDLGRWELKVEVKVEGEESEYLFFYPNVSGVNRSAFQRRILEGGANDLITSGHTSAHSNAFLVNHSDSSYSHRKYYLYLDEFSDNAEDSNKTDVEIFVAYEKSRKHHPQLKPGITLEGFKVESGSGSETYSHNNIVIESTNDYAVEISFEQDGNGSPANFQPMFCPQTNDFNCIITVDDSVIDSLPTDSILGDVFYVKLKVKDEDDSADQKKTGGTNSKDFVVFTKPNED